MTAPGFRRLHGRTGTGLHDRLAGGRERTGPLREAALPAPLPVRPHRLRAARPAAVAAHRVIEEGVGGGIAGKQTATWPSAPASRSASSSQATATGRRGWRGRRRDQPAWRPGRPRPPCAARPAAGRRLRVVEGGVGGGAISQRGCLARAAPASRSASSSRATAARVVEGGVGGGIAGEQRGCLLIRARLAAARPAARRRRRVVEGGAGGGTRASSAAACSAAPASRSASSSRATAPGLSRAAWAAGSRASNAAAWSSAPASRSASSSSATANGSSRAAWAAARSAARRPGRPRPPRAARPAAGDGARVVEAGVGGGAGGQRG